jgi:pyruvate formate lyase activating enzyme
MLPSESGENQVHFSLFFSIFKQCELCYSKDENNQPRLYMKAVITNIQGYSIHDGPGIRTVVFLKGCPLRCRWCANPECISPEVQVGFISSLCTNCHKCFSVCPENALTDDGLSHRIDYSRCTGRGKCADVCDYGALVRYGTEMSALEVFEAVRRDKMFYDTSGGGVTVSGGEPLLQAHFVKALFELCKADGINTCIETCGCVPSQNLLDVLPLTDYLLFDLKHMDADIHSRYTGQPNNIILKNAALAAEKGADILFRIPLIPGVNDDEDNINATAGFILGLPGRHSVQLMPYHRLGDSKYKALNLLNTMSDKQIMTQEQINAVQQRFISRGVDCSVST